MAEYIDIDKAIVVIDTRGREIETTVRHILDFNKGTYEAADVQPVRHGRWFMRGGKWRCSECDQKALLRLSDATGGCREYEYYRANYCPNCGAKMEGIE